MLGHACHTSMPWQELGLGKCHPLHPGLAGLGEECWPCALPSHPGGGREPGLLCGPLGCVALGWVTSLLP